MIFYFVDKAYKVIEANFENQNFDVDLFCSEMTMSRVKLYSKMKCVSGLTPKDFIQNVKIKKAADLLINNPKLLIADITYKLGFSSTKYFSKSYKKLFGIIPTEYLEKNKRELEN